MSSVAVVDVDSANVNQSIEDGLRKLAPSKPEIVALVFPSDVRVSAALAGVIASGVEQVGSLRELVLVHPGATVGFLASSLGLRIPRCKVRGERDLARVEGRPRNDSLTPPHGSATILDLRDRSLTQAFNAASMKLGASQGNRAVLLLNPDETPPPGLTDLVVKELSLCPKLREVVLVHPSAVMGFIASSAGLRLPTLSLSAVRQAPKA